MNELFIGIDIGTSGCRAAAIDGAGKAAGQAAMPMPPPRTDGTSIDQDPAIWWSAARQTLAKLLAELDAAAVRAIAVDGTSGTLLLSDGAGVPLGPALMYNDSRAAGEAARIAEVAPATSGAIGATSALAKLLHLNRTGRTDGAAHALHQADWIAGRLAGRYGISDENNALKLGYDVVELRWPDWLQNLGVDHQLLPEVLAPGTSIGPIAPDHAGDFGLRSDVQIVAGTTDGVAAFLATGASVVGEAVTSLGSTLVIKQLADRPLFDPDSGVYSHRLGELWLPGGASNSGGQALLQFFDQAAIERLTPDLRPDRPTGFDYYPLTGRGERFPVNNADKQSVTEPRPDDDAVFLQALLEGIAEVEALGYERLRALGGPTLASVRTVGGGAANDAWTAIRRRRLRVPMLDPDMTEAAYGAARLAKKGYDDL